MKTYITYDAGFNIWEVELFDAKIKWHNNEFQGTRKECELEAKEQMEESTAHYPNAEYESIYDY